MPDLVDTFRSDHPRVRFRLHSSDDARGSMVLADSHLDLELTARRPTEEGVSWEHLFTQPLVLAVSLEHPLADRTEVRLEEVADDDFVMLRPSWELRGQTDGLCREAGFTPRSAFEADDLAVVRGFVAAGLGVAVIPADGFSPGETFGRERHLRITDVGAHREVGMAWPSERRLLPSAELFRLPRDRPRAAREGRGAAYRGTPRVLDRPSRLAAKSSGPHESSRLSIGDGERMSEQPSRGSALTQACAPRSMSWPGRRVQAHRAE